MSNDRDIRFFRTAISRLLLETGRSGIDSLIAWMGGNGFFTAPCSTQYHLNVEGGLAKHSYNVWATLNTFCEAMAWPDKAPSKETLTIVALLHDLGKTGDFGKPMYTPNILKSGEQSASKPFEVNSELMYVPHEIRSICIAERFIHLTEEEEHAILYHNGLYSGLGYEWKGKEQPLDLALHFADMWCCRALNE